MHRSGKSLCLTGRRKNTPIKILGGLILGGYIYRYTPRRYAPECSTSRALDDTTGGVVGAYLTEARVKYAAIATFPIRNGLRMYC